jgi:DNA-binding CsgD family transcriptional regulator
MTIKKSNLKYWRLVTPMQRRALLLLIQGYHPSEAQTIMNLGKSAFNAHIQRARRRMDCRTMYEMIAVAVRDQVLQDVKYNERLKQSFKERSGA